MIFRSRIIDCFKYLNKEKLERSYFTYQKTVKMGTWEDWEKIAYKQI